MYTGDSDMQIKNTYVRAHVGSGGFPVSWMKQGGGQRA